MPSAPNWACSMDSCRRMVGPFCMCCATTPSAGATAACLRNKLLRVHLPSWEMRNLELDSCWTSSVEKSLVSDTGGGPAVLYLPQFYQAETYVAGRLAAKMEQLTMNPRRI